MLIVIPSLPPQLTQKLLSHFDHALLTLNSLIVWWQDEKSPIIDLPVLEWNEKSANIILENLLSTYIIEHNTMTEQLQMYRKDYCM